MGRVFPPLPRGEGDGTERGLGGERGVGEDVASQKKQNSLSVILRFRANNDCKLTKNKTAVDGDTLFV
jgi:hypothetical protein